MRIWIILVGETRRFFGAYRTLELARESVLKSYENCPEILAEEPGGHEFTVRNEELGKFHIYITDRYLWDEVRPALTGTVYTKK